MIFNLVVWGLLIMGAGAIAGIPGGIAMAVIILIAKANAASRQRG